MLNVTVANFGCMNASIDTVASDAGLMQLCQNAVVTIVQMTGAQNLTNKHYSVHPRRNDRLVQVSDDLVAEFPGIEFRDIYFTRHLLSSLQLESSERFDRIRRDLQENWVYRFRATLDEIGGQIVLLWLADHIPGANPYDKPLGHDPMFVDRSMIDQLTAQTPLYVEVIATQDEIDAGFERMVFSPMEEPAACEMLGPIVHQATARELIEVLRPLI